MQWRNEMSKIRVCEALDICEETNVECASCVLNVSIEDERYCLYCKTYWEDRNGLFDEDETSFFYAMEK